METSALTLSHTSSSISRIAKRNYNTYLRHYQLRNLKPMTFDEFFKNYNI